VLENIRIRLGKIGDANVIAKFNLAMALETENKKLSQNVLLSGVRALLANPRLGFYIVAECEGEILGSLMVTKEWSDWRNGIFWWIQSVYVRPDYRRKGIYRRLYSYVKLLSAEEANICGFRLYVEKDNEIAKKAYKVLGMSETHYEIYEELRSN